MENLEVKKAPETKEFKNEFETTLKSVEFDKEDLSKQMYSRLTESKGYSLLKGEITKTRDASALNVSEDQVKDYIARQGGDGYLKEIFNRGRVGLMRDLNDTEQKFATQLKVHKEQSEKGVEPVSIFGKKFAEFVKNAGDINNIKFEDAVNAGLYDLKADMNHIVEYGLTYFEYKNRKQRLDALKRQKLSKETTAKIVVGEAVVEGYQEGNMRKDSTIVNMRTGVDGAEQAQTSEKLQPKEKKERRIYFADEFSEGRIDGILKFMKKPLQTEGVGETEAVAKINSWKKMLNILADKAFDVKDISPLELAEYTEEIQSQKVDEQTYKVTMKVKEDRLRDLVRMYINKKTIGPPKIGQ